MTLDPPAERPRNAAATRAAILESAVVAFTRSGYDGAGVREIAQAAGVTAMLVNRYFGSKEQLFREVVDVVLAPPTIVPEDSATLAHRVAETLTARTTPEAEHLDPFLLMLRSASNPRANEIVRTGIERYAGRRLAALLPGPRPDERSELLLSLIAGVWLLRKVVGTTALAAMEPADLTRRLEEVFGAAIAPDPDEPADRGRAESGGAVE
ncbi:TetR/AcrR family transcriptional regulator [Pseudonocardia xinjiangensis]|uniref:TetR/AcrR family transcriptional regulator n=1 Tax=Pseudonocardia xinjiangensis TaxID=75289 RepID=UPI003D89F55D